MYMYIKSYCKIHYGGNGRNLPFPNRHTVRSDDQLQGGHQYEFLKKNERKRMKNKENKAYQRKWKLEIINKDE